MYIYFLNSNIYFKARRTDSSATSILYEVSDWEMQVELKKELEEVATTTLRPEMVLLSRSTKTIIVVELTVP